MNEQRNYEIFKKLINKTGKVLFSFDADASRLTFLSHSFSQIWRRPPESVIANPELILQTIHPDDRDYLVTEYEELLSGVLKERIEFRIKLPDNSARWLQLSPQLIITEDGTRFIAGMLDDITIAKENINTLQKYGAKKNSVLEILSHDLSGPLATIQMLADALSDQTKEYGSDEVDKIIGMIRKSSERNIRMIRDFVQQEFLESSNVELFKRRVDLVRKTREIMEQYKDGEKHIQKEILFTTSSDKIFVYIDDPKFMQVINNLFSNAIKFTHDNGIISLDLKEQEDTVLITVKDNGIGIPPKYHKELFDKFTRARREGLRGEPSTGLGMSIIKTIVEWHNGRIWFESEVNVGTTFYIEIPKE
jgi:two-component system, OmpR family, sensor histidine kinase VicK